MIEIKRHIIKKVIAHLDKKEITVLTGPRQVGKTTLLTELNNYLQQKKKETLFFNIDKDSDKEYFQSQETLLKKIALEIGDTGYVFIDEVQRLENAGLFLKGIYDRNLPYKIIISGSGSIELKEQIQESLAGRKRVFYMSPVTFEEFVNYKTNYKYENRLPLYFDLEKEQTSLLLKEYLNFGGYPRIVTETNSVEKVSLLDEIYKSYVEKDLVYLLNINRPEIFNMLIKMLAYQMGNLVNYTEISKKLGISVDTLKKYIWYAEKTFSIQQATPYFTNKLKEITKSPIFYFNDVGLRNFSLGMMGNLQLPEQFGLVFENFIHNILKNACQWKNWSVHFWRTTDKAEVDFILNKGSEIIPIEVKFTDFNEPRITKSFRSFLGKYEPPTAYVITQQYEENISIGKSTVMFLPFYKLEGMLNNEE